jgi:hypothetical protein
MLISEILTIDLSEEIKNVIDLEDISEKEIQTEIEGYIVTDGLAREYADFVSKYTSNIRETGVWISGFYGSGKSYFGKLLGYLLSNRKIAGTPARDRILQRFTGIADESLIKNQISKLNSMSSRVVFLDIAKQDTSKGLSFAFFKNFLRTLSFPENEHGIFLFQLMLSESKTNVGEYIQKETGLDWNEYRTNTFRYAKVIKDIFIKKGNSESYYENQMTTIRRDIDQFSSSRLKEELSNYLTLEKSEKIVFLFDEASEAINQKKFNLLDLEGISESLSSLGGRVWTIAIAQEKLDDVINNSNVSKAQLTKVTDRFKTKIHLEATEVDVIIQNRLLKKTPAGIQSLQNYFNQNSGMITDHASIQGAGISQTDSVDSYSTYYPFYKYQFDLLQNFLFGTKGYASTKVAARGMIITTYDILRQEVQKNELFHTVTGWHIAREGQPQPPVRLVNRYDNADRILREAKSKISGRKLLETINFLTESEVTPATFQNIVKCFISHPEEFHMIQSDINKALEILTTSKILLETNSTFRITSDIEQRLLDEMNGFSVQGHNKKKQTISVYKDSNLLRNVSKYTDNGLQFDFYITTDNDDELCKAGQKFLKLKIKSIYNISENRLEDIENLKVQHQNDKDILWLVPDNQQFTEMDRLIEDIEKITYLEQKYNNPNSEEGRILISFTTSKSEKSNRLKNLLEDSLLNGTLIYLYNTYQLSKENSLSILHNQQRTLIQNVYSKRLASQLSDAVAVSVVKEANNGRLVQYFAGSDFTFFDAQGNFIGENLKVSEEILYKIRNTFVEGTTLETELNQPPCGFSYGTVVSSVAALMRAGKVIAKYNGAEKFSWRDEGVIGIFNSPREFRKASFKAVTKSLSINQKQEIAQFLLDMEVDKYIGRKVDFNTNDFELVTAIRDTAKHFSDKVSTLKNSEKEFNKFFPKAEEKGTFLNSYTGVVSESNYTELAVEFLNSKSDFQTAIESIEKIEKFMRNNLSKVKEWKTFINSVEDELKKVAISNEILSQEKTNFYSLLDGDVIQKFSELQTSTQKTKDEYHNLFSNAMKQCGSQYTELESLSKGLLSELATLPQDLNAHTTQKANALLQFAEQRKGNSVELDFDVKDKKSRFTYSEVLSFIDLFPSKKTEISIHRANLIKEKPPEPKPDDPKPGTKKFTISIPSEKTKVREFRAFLQSELQKLATASDEDEVEFV